MHVLELRRGQPAALGLEVERLPADHAAGPGGAKQLERDPAARLGRERREARIEHPCAQGDHVIARHHRRRYVEGAVRRGPPAAQVVVVHAGEIVVHQRVGMDDFDRGREVGHALRGGFARHRLGGGEDERRPQALAGREQAVPHRRGHRGGPPLPCPHAPRLQHRVHPGPGVREVRHQRVVRRRGLQPGHCPPDRRGPASLVPRRR